MGDENGAGNWKLAFAVYVKLMLQMANNYDIIKLYAQK